MKRWMICLVFVVALLGLVGPVSASELTIVKAFNYETFPCDNQVHYSAWWNPEPTAIKIQWTKVLQAMTSQSRAVFRTNLYLYERAGQAPPYDLLHSTQWDRYAEPALPSMSTWSYEPNWITVPVGQGILMESACYVMASPGGIAQVSAFVGYVK